ncbi:hypothetical protein [Listeria rocourtiae]|uniref:hypothetical protein n=1 Tax=Listeria rocourtiae TaxID=647910 RepID=UPI0003E87C5C|nr:hypothetical protein [Listeria rocourtiae]EUJ44393.1 hypothetical protein PROCOU_13858 [Listeria rocourtiae FSL F6-920]
MYKKTPLLICTAPQNSGELDFDTYPDQATVLVEGQQLEASMLASDNIGGEILKGAKKRRYCFIRSS